MTWWDKLFGTRRPRSLQGLDFQTISILYSEDGKRAAEIRNFSDGKTYLLESEWVADTTFQERHEGRMVGPFASPKRAERFIIGTSWFRGEDPAPEQPS